MDKKGRRIVLNKEVIQEKENEFRRIVFKTKKHFNHR